MSRLRMYSFSFVAVLSIVAVPSTAQADLFTNLDSGFKSQAGFIDNWMVNAQAMRFTVPAGAGDTLTSIEIPLSMAPSGAFDEIKLAVYSDNSNTPGTELDSYTITGLTTTQTLYTGTFTGGVSLLAGTQYWVVASDISNGSAQYSWHGSNSATGSDRSMLDTNGMWSAPTTFSLAFSVNPLPETAVTPVPVPAPEAVMLGMMGLSIVGYWRRRQELA